MWAFLRLGRPRWEYHAFLVELDGRWLQEATIALDNAGAAGWELVALLPRNNDAILAVFKREIR